MFRRCRPLSATAICILAGPLAGVVHCSEICRNLGSFLEFDCPSNAIEGEGVSFKLAYKETVGELFAKPGGLWRRVQDTLLDTRLH